MRTPALCITLLLLLCTAFASRYTVTNTNDSGYGSLREAINVANSGLSAGPDVIVFSPSLSGEVIHPTTQLPTLTEEGLAINGDIDGNGTPDIAIAPGKGGLPKCSGLLVRATGCTVRGLAICGFRPAILLWQSRSCRVVGCYLGVTPAGRRWAPGHESVYLHDSSDNTIGGTNPKDWNIIAVGKYYGILLSTKHGRPSTSNNVIAGNYIGLTPDGSGVLNRNKSEGPTGIQVGGGQSVGNIIGGHTAGAGNVFGGMNTGVKVIGASDTKIKGNLFGLRADGDSAAWIGNSAINVSGGATGTRIGGAAPGAGNVFAGKCKGMAAVQIRDTGTRGTVISGNYFGTNRDGTARRRLRGGITMWPSAGRTTIGGNTPDHGNYFTPSLPNGWGAPIRTYDSGPITIRHNRFGILPQGGDTTGIGTAIRVAGGHVRIFDNTIARVAVYGLLVTAGGTPSYASVQRNLFRHCGTGVWISQGTCRLGDLGNANSNDDGGNEFKASNIWFIGNTTLQIVKAEGNIFPSTVMSEIDEKIWDQLDCPAGRVDFDPLDGGVIPTGSAASLVLTATAAVPTGAGAQITFSLSSAAEVRARILNIAGRPIRTLCTAHECAAGTNTLIWNAMSDDGLRAPNGAYLVEVSARADDGRQARALTRVNLR